MPGAREGFVLREFAGAVEPVAAHLAKLGRQEGQPGLRGAAPPPPPHSRPPAHSSALSTMYIRDWMYSYSLPSSNAKCSCECVEWQAAVWRTDPPQVKNSQAGASLFLQPRKKVMGCPGWITPSRGQHRERGGWHRRQVRVRRLVQGAGRRRI